ncbi:T9SS type A sorting domain-containing protein [Prevotella copri]|uniref:T9SS type A sorting domain-containing protein n=1 Tax=Segatella copri TaxID=165179 RepID=A0A6G1TY72_9BACT|nr:T9SS type A sorting domain-containing protein [Segatella copri]MQN79869.1 T9SS type A sorting domain-containing protein [Segatella copri]
MSTLYFTPPTDVNLEGAKIVLHLSNEEGLLTGAAKEQATYTYNIRLAENLADYSMKEASEPTNVISKKYVVDQNNAQARVKLDMNDVKYMRWQVLDKDGSVISPVSSLLTGEAATNYQVVKDKYVWAKFESYEPNNIAGESERTVTFNLPSGKTWDDGYQVVCYWATDKSDGDFYSDGTKAYFFQEPTLSGKCVFSFMSKTAAESATFTPNISSNVQKTTEIRATTDASFTISMPNTAKYMRWYVADKDGKVVDKIDALTPDGSATAKTYIKKGNYYIWYNNDKEANSNDLKMTFTLPSGSTWTDGYQVICAWASSSAGSDILYDDNNNNYYLLKEPNLSGLYVTAFTTAEQIKSKDLALSSLSKTAVDESDVYMVNDGIEQVTVTIPKHSVKYVRWQLIDMTTGKTVDAVGEDGNQIFTNSSFTNRKKGSFVYYSATSSSDQSVRQINFDKSQISGAGEWSNYQLKAVWTDNVDGIDAPTLDTKPFVVAEPSVLQGAYTVNFKTVAQATADMKLSSALSSNVISESDNFAVSGSKVTVTVPTHYLRYIRWQVIDKTTGKVIEDLPEGTLSSSSTYNRGKGNVIGYSETSVSNENLRTITFDKSKLNTPGDWKNYQLKAVWTNDVTGMTSYIKTDGTRYIVSEPSVMQGVYTVSFADKSAVGTLVTSTEPTTVKSVDGILINNAKKQININLNHKLDEILSALGKSSVSELGNLYIRWTVTDADGNSFTTNGLEISSKKYNDFDSNKYFNVLTKDPSSELADLLKVSFASELYSFDITKVTNISCVITDDIEGLKETEEIVTTEPTHLKLKYQVKITDPAKVPFRHYKGYANADGDYEVIDASKGQLRQKTYTWEYTYPVEVGKPVPLTLPMEDFDGVDAHGHGGLEPLGYYRWYNYDTDEASANIKADTQDTNYLHEISDEKGNKKGLLAYNLDKIQPWQGNLGVNYTRPADKNWKGETIACDVSRYVDGIDETGTYMDHESTLSIRYIFHLIPAKQMADMEMNYLTHSDNDLTYEDNKNVTVGFANAMSTMTLRLNMKPTMYYFYPMINNKHHVYFPTGQSDRDIVAADFGKELKQATKVIWRIYNGDKDKYCDFESNVDKFPRFFDVYQNLLNSASAWKNLDGNSVTGNITFNYGDHFSVVAYAVDESDNSSCPIANFNCRFFGFHPMMDSEMGNDEIQRKIFYLEENYNRVAMVSFDNDSPEQTLSAPTNDMDNQSEHPSDWSKRNYGFVYKSLLSKSAQSGVAFFDPMHSPLHGEYGIYKTANVPGVSTNSDKYLWHYGSELHDRTWELSGGSQTGSFLYIDASDESRTIASAEFNASICTGQQMAFSAYVADITGAQTMPQLMFKLYGLVGNQKVLLHNFSSGDFESNRDSKEKGKWYQVYGKITIQKESHAEQYDKFRIEIDNYSEGTQGADYAVDDIRIYLKPAKVEVFQDRPACGENGEGKVKLKIRAIHETLNAILNHTDTKIHFRFVEEDGTPVKGTGLYNYNLDGAEKAMPDGYASVDVYDSEAACKSHTIDGVNMIETDAYGETYIILANHKFGLKAGKKYYVSVCADSDPNAPNAQWGKPSDVCSIYSDLFELIGQTPAIIDNEGNVITDYRVDCADPNPSVKLKGSLTTIDPKTGAKIMLKDVPFYWYIDQKTTPYNSTASNEITIPVSDKYGAHTIYMKPAPNGTNADGEEVYITPDGVSYLLCDEAVPVPLRIAKDGPQLNFGFNDVYYPFNDATYKSALRIGLPQIKKLLNQNETNSSEGYLQVPLHSASYKTGVEDKTLTFIDDSKTGANTSADVYVATTNDPLWNKTGATLLSAPVAKLKSTEIGEVGTATQATLDLLFLKDVLDNFHEGYYYDLRFVFEQKAAGGSSCPGEAYLKVKIVPEFITWTPTANGGMNANWNNDDNWHRSSSTELHDNEYTNYLPYGSSMPGTPASAQDIPTQNSYVPMKFTKVTVVNLNGKPFPDLGNIVYRQENGIATKLNNAKGDVATTYIQYDIMAYWDEAAANKGFETDGNLKCEKFYGNTCHQIYFKPKGELRDQCYLIYDKAWVEKELVPNKWYTMASPLQYIYAGDMYVPASNGRQETKAFTDIKYNDKVEGSSTSDAYSRSKYPVYQKAWMKSDVKEITSDGEHDAWHKPSGEASKVDVNLGYWSHVYNKVDECYTDGSFGGFAIKAGNALLPKRPTDGTPLPNALLRLPKEDTSYQYFDYDGSTTSGGKSVQVGKAGHGKLLVAFNNDEKHLAEMTQNLGTDNNSGFYLVANPYTCSISLKKFFEVNTGLQKAVWVVDGDDVNSVSATDLADKDFFVQPTQSFFVKKDGTTSVDAVKFTSAMYVDRLLSTGVIIAPGYLTNVNVSAQNAKGQTSKARIAVREEASDDYDEQEDVDLLCDQNLSGIPQVYTVAGSQAVAVNATPKIEWMPMGVIMENGEKNEMVNLDLKGVAKLDAPLYLYDAANGQYTELQDGNEVSIQANEHGRYFLTQTRGTTGIQQIEAEAESNQLKVYSPAPGMIVVSALNGEKLGSVEVFTLDGKMVHSYQLPDKQRMILRVPSGVYIVKASTQSCAQSKGLKVAVR